MPDKKNQLVKVEPVEVELVESLPPEASLPAGLPTTEAELNRRVDLRVAEIMAHRDDFQPYFQSRRVAQELKRIQSVPEQRLWSIYYERWGCTHCDTIKRPHSSCGMCGPCKFKIGYRRKEIQREQSGEKEHPVPRVCEDCGQRFSPMTDAQWEQAREKHEISKHNRKVEGVVARSCSICRKDFHPMSEAQWEYVYWRHERGESHRRAMREREARRPYMVRTDLSRVERDQRIIERRRAGATWKQIGEELGLSRRAVGEAAKMVQQRRKK